MNRRIFWLDGLRGISCILIFAHHFMLIFYPAIHFGAAEPSRMAGLDTALSQSPFSVLLNGNFLVAIFCTVSGLVAAMGSHKRVFWRSAIKRYLRLMLPLLPISLLIYGMVRLGAFPNVDNFSSWAAQYRPSNISFLYALRASIWDVWFGGDTHICTAFWMLSELFLGSLLSSLLIKAKKHALWLIPVAIIGGSFIRSGLLSAFALGAGLSLLPKTAFQKKFGIPALLAGILLGAYPSGVTPTNFYRFLTFLPCQIWHIWGAVLFLYGIFSLPGLQNALSAPWLQKTGTLCYSVFLLHIPLLFSFSTGIFLLLRNILPFGGCVAITFILSLAVLLGISWLYHRFVEKPILKRI